MTILLRLQATMRQQGKCIVLLDCTDEDESSVLCGVDLSTLGWNNPEFKMTF